MSGGREWKARPWSEEYYDAVDHYFWDPGILEHFSHSYLERHFGVKDSHGSGRPERVLDRIRRLEDPLNHILGIFFALAPQALVSHLIQKASAEASEGPYQVLGKSVWKHLDGATQPDICFVAGNCLTSIEVKVPGGHSDVQQIVKYGLVAMRAREHLGVSHCRLIYLTPYDLPRIFRPAVGNWDAVRASAIELAPDMKQQVFCNLGADERLALQRAIADMELSGLSFPEFDSVLGAYLDAAARPEVEARLIGGLRAELRNRKLVGA